MPVFVAGLGAISGIGNNVAECLHSLQESRHGIAPMVYLQSEHRNRLPVAEVKLSNSELAQLTGLPVHISRTALLSLVAAKEAFLDAGLPSGFPCRKAFVSANSVGGMDKTENFFPAFAANHEAGHLREVIHHECGAISEIVAKELGVTDFVSTISTACSSSANAIFYGARLIKNDLADVVIAGGCDSLTKFTLNGFNTLMILDENPCQPFDENRRGLNLGEGAGYIVLVSEKIAGMLHRMPKAVLSGYANANDAYHQTASSPDGTGSFLAMTGALKMAGLHPEEIDYINLHGTGTQNNDIAEGTAIQRIFSNPYPLMSSTKSFTGHTLGACGGLEAVFSVLSLQHGIVFPNLRLETPMKELPFTPVTRFKSGISLQHVMSNSFGFGGNCSSLIFSKS
ncbi:MAG: beta-ketoacyl-[acyl-carrier-protein] synthase family protein [Chitinophagaceae bacterium]|nr:beta-ketoacyl-[acyl-carrier-protein] synthase family protein [Bacteroidota bacterium]MCC6256924.1 beta-ketoacyl-[acyl-carrier-protein] synthase family protein [Chitinophagaceae bacterium]